MASANVNTQNVTLRISAGYARQFPRDPLRQIAFSGRSNVGKSSLINTLLGRKNLARVSATPGKTITINFYDVDGKLFLVDLPGYGFARRDPASRQAWSALTDGYFTKNDNIDRLSLVVQLIDSRTGITADDRTMLEFLNASDIPYVIVATKVDKLNVKERRASLDALAADPVVRTGARKTGDVPVIPFSSLRGEGRDALWREIFSHINL